MVLQVFLRIFALYAQCIITLSEYDHNTGYRLVDSAAGHHARLCLRLPDEGRDAFAPAEIFVRVCIRCDGCCLCLVVAHSRHGDGRSERSVVGHACSHRLPIGHLHIGTDKPEGMRSHLSKTAMLALAVTIHNLPEGMAVGVVFAGAENGLSNISLASAIAVSLGIAIQNVPEGAIISMPMRAAGNSRWKSFFIGSLSGAVEPIGALAVLLLASVLMPVLPYMLTFAAGAMFYVVIEELIPEASSGQHSNLSTIGFAIGFVLMMVLDVVLG